MRNQVRMPLCKNNCGKETKRLDRLHCSHKCYTESGRRKECGKVNGAQAYKLYWKKFYEIFQRKYGHLNEIDQTRLLVNIGMRRAYRKTYNQQFKKELNAK